MLNAMESCPALRIMELQIENDRLVAYAATVDRQIIAVGKINYDLMTRLRRMEEAIK